MPAEPVADCLAPYQGRREANPLNIGNGGTEIRSLNKGRRREGNVFVESSKNKMSWWKRDSAGCLRQWGCGERGRGETKASVKRVSGEDLKAKIIKESGCTRWQSMKPL